MKDRVVVLGFLSHFPVAGVAWQTAHYLVGFQRLGFDVFYVEAHGCAPSKLMQSESDDGAALAAGYIQRVLSRFDLGDRWAYVSRYPEERRLGPAAARLDKIYRSAAFILNLHGGHMPAPELTAANRLVYVGTDPVEIETELHEKKKETIDFLSAHCACFTFGENIGRPGCLVPSPAPFEFRPTRQPVVMDFWEEVDGGPAAVFTTVGNWRQPWRTVKLGGTTYRWSKHLEFEKYIDLPARVQQPFELALSSCDEKDRRELERHGWRVIPALDLSGDVEDYRRYVRSSRGEFTVAKEQNVRLRSGWFSDRSATYLAAGRPVITQDTGFGETLPVGEGLFPFNTMDEAVRAVEAVNADYERHRRAARAVARECFSHDVVLGRMAEELGVRPKRPRVAASGSALAPGLALVAVGRWPTRLPDETMAVASDLPVPAATSVAPASGPRVSVIVVTHNGLPYTKMCLTSLLRNGWKEGDELIVVDNASTDGTGRYLEELARRNPPFVRYLPQASNTGFAAANNRGLEATRGGIFVLLNNDTLVPRGWRDALAARLCDPTTGLAGPVTNRTCNEAQIDAGYRTYGEFEAFAADRARRHAGEETELGMLAMFCLAMRRDTFERVGMLDERFGMGMFEDDDYSRRVRDAGLRIVCAEDVFVHHFGQASLGELCVSGDYDRLFEENRRRFEAKWGEPWMPHGRRITPAYRELRERIRDAAAKHVPEKAVILVVSKGDDELLEIPGRTGWHFPRSADGAYANEYPADSEGAVAQLESLRGKGARFLLLPKPGFWWLEHYAGFRDHLEGRYRALVKDAETCAIFDLEDPRG